MALTMKEGKQFSILRHESVDRVHFDHGSFRVGFDIVEEMRVGMAVLKQRIRAAWPSQRIGFLRLERHGAQEIDPSDRHMPAVDPPSYRRRRDGERLGKSIAEYFDRTFPFDERNQPIVEGVDLGFGQREMTPGVFQPLEAVLIDQDRIPEMPLFPAIVSGFAKVADERKPVKLVAQVLFEPFAFIGTLLERFLAFGDVFAFMIMKGERKDVSLLDFDVGGDHAVERRRGDVHRYGDLRCIVVQGDVLVNGEDLVIAEHGNGHLAFFGRNTVPL